MTAVIYARYSTDSQREESIEGQIRECTAYAEKNGCTVVKHYIDRAVSAKTDNRPQFQQRIKDLSLIHIYRGMSLADLMNEGSELYNNSYARMVQEQGEEKAEAFVSRCTTQIAENGEIIRSFAA